MSQNSIQDLRAFDIHLFDLLEQYINNPDEYPADTVLAISDATTEVIIDSPDNIDQSFDQYPIDSLIRCDEQGAQEPDSDETYELASKYFFVR